MGSIILTSQGFYNEKIISRFKELAKDVMDEPAVVISTASDEKNENKWVKKAKEQLLECGYKEVDIIDIESETSKDPSIYKTIYVAGGNGFRLTDAARKSNFKDVITNCINNGGVYVGVSAGSTLLAPSIKLEQEFEPEEIPAGFTDFSGLSLVPNTIFPHYDASLENRVQSFEEKNGYKVIRLTNDDALVYEKVYISPKLIL